MRTAVEVLADERVDVYPVRMTYDEWRAWAEDRQILTEWVDGEVIVRVPSEPHQDLLVFLTTVLRLFVDLRGLGKILVAPFEMHLERVGTAREPDILFISHESMGRLSDPRLEGPADLVMELASDSTARYDRKVKLDEYARAGVPECWLIDPRRGKRRVEPFWLTGDGDYAPIEADARGRYHSRVLTGFWIDRRWIEAPQPPLAVHALMRIAGNDFLAQAAAAGEMEEDLE